MTREELAELLRVAREADQAELEWRFENMPYEDRMPL